MIPKTTLVALRFQAPENCWLPLTYWNLPLPGSRTLLIWLSSSFLCVLPPSCPASQFLVGLPVWHFPASSPFLQFYCSSWLLSYILVAAINITVMTFKSLSLIQVSWQQIHKSKCRPDSFTRISHRYSMFNKTQLDIFSQNFVCFPTVLHLENPTH